MLLPAPLRPPTAKGCWFKALALGPTPTNIHRSWATKPTTATVCLALLEQCRCSFDACAVVPCLRKGVQGLRHLAEGRVEGEFGVLAQPAR